METKSNYFGVVRWFLSPFFWSEGACTAKTLHFNLKVHN